MPFVEALDITGNMFVMYKASPNATQRAHAIKSIFNLVAFQHLGFGEVPGIRERVEMGIDLSVDYFGGDWWTPDGINRLEPEKKSKFRLDDPKQLENTVERNARALNKSHPERELEWYSALRGGLFFGGLSERWEDVMRICSWFDATIEPEYSAGTIENQLFQLYICIAGSLSPEPMEGADQLLQQVKNCRLKRIRLLCAAWEAVIAADQAAFDKAFTETVKHFVANPSAITIAYEWVAMHQSIIWLIAEHRGLQFPAMSDKCRAAVVTPQSLGFTD